MGLVFGDIEVATTRCFCSPIGDCVAAKLRPGNVSSADDWEELLVPEIDRQQAEGQRVAFRADAAFARPAIYEAWRRAASSTRSGCQRTRTWSWRSTSCFVRRDGRATSRWSGTRVSGIRRRAGPRRADRGRAPRRRRLHRDESPALIAPSCGSTTSGAPSNGSAGHDCPVTVRTRLQLTVQPRTCGGGWYRRLRRQAAALDGGSFASSNSLWIGSSASRWSADLIAIGMAITRSAKTRCAIRSLTPCVTRADARASGTVAVTVAVRAASRPSR